MPRLITLKLDKKLLAEIDKRVSEGFYSSRTEYFRALAREDILKNKEQQLSAVSKGQRVVCISKKHLFKP